MMRMLAACCAVALVACSSAPEKKAEAPAAAPPVKDNTAQLLPLNRTSAKVVPEHLLGKSALPGGTLGEYDEGGTKYRLFIIETASAQDAAILLLDLKATLKDPAYIAYMGGYFGTDASGPVYTFARGKYLAGVTGLSEDKADPIARQLAARL
ncbi:MAG TPA: hypothetical protein VG297_07385 [Bryobacteraceae bacterium]|jgi:hypothetical protein|nr:hypothetical protein [Bryobacteraceae bacterium]